MMLDKLWQWDFR